MSTEKQEVTVQDLAEEAKKRVVFLIMCALGLSYLLSLTSSSVWANLPAATFLIVTLRYFYLDFDMRIKAAVYNSQPTLAHISSEMKPFEGPKTGLMKSDWRRKVNSPVVEDALDQFTRHLVSEWVTDLWYSRLTPDRQGPEELVQIMNGVLGEISFRLRNVNLVDLLTRDIINILCTHLELFRSSRSKIEKQQLGPLTFERRDMELKSVLFADNKLHPALFSAEAEHKVLQYLMDGLISLTFKPEDLQCSLFCFIVRELLACAVMRPLLNLANPRFLNERVECVVISLSKANKGASTALVASQSKSNASSRISSDQSSGFLDPSVKGVELVPLKKDPSKTLEEKSMKDNTNGTFYSKDPLLSMDTGSTRSWSSLPSDPQNGDDRNIQRHNSEENRVDTLDGLSSRKTEALAPDHSENYRRKEDENDAIEPEIESSSAVDKTANNSNVLSRDKEKDSATKISSDQSTAVLSGPNGNITSHISAISYVDYEENDLMRLEEVESGSSSYTSEDEESSSATGLDSPVTKVWDGKNNRYLSVSHIHHPLESSEGLPTRKAGIGHLQARLRRTHSWRKRSNRLSSQKRHIWQEVGRTSFSSGDGRDILNSFKGHVESEDSSDDYEAEVLGRIHSGATASSSTSSTSLLDSDNLAVNAQKNSLLADTFLKLRCEVLGANIVKGGSRTFAVYSISVTDTNDNSWSIKRRFRHFEELHRRLKEFPEYNLHLPPKRFLSTGLDVLVIQERCKLLHKYLKKLLQLPTISGSIEIWDFLSVDSQTYLFSHSISIIETLSVDLDSTTHERSEEVQNGLRPTVNTIPSSSEHRDSESKESALAMKHNILGDGSRVKAQGALHTKQQKPSEDSGSYSDKSDQRNISLSRKSINRSEGDNLQTSSQSIIGASSDPTLPTEWVPPNLSAPILDLVDVIFQLQDGGWIRRKAFWAAKQILQLGMGDAFDDWLIEKIQILRRGSVVASGIKRIEQFLIPGGTKDNSCFLQVLWPDGIFIAKHPKRRRPNPSRCTPGSSPHGQPPTSVSSPKKVDAFELDENQLKEAERRARFVHELMIDNAPAAIVGLVGHKGYEQCAKDLYDFLQSSVCLKQLAFDLLELLLLSAFPEMDYIFRQLHEEKEKFGEFRPT